MNNNIAATLVGVLIVIGVLAFGASMYNKVPVPTNPPGVTVPPTGPLVAEGMIVCLPHKNPGEIQTLECAYGLRNNAGTYFALSDTDPTYKNISSAPMNTPVRIEGTFALRANSNYQDIGVISVTKITPLNPDGSSAATTPQVITVGLNKTGSALDVQVTPREVLEDSRCPIDVVCIQAGTVRVRATLTSGLGTGDQTFKLGETITTEAENVTLTRVDPSSVAGQTINDSSYIFHFEVSKR